VLFCCVLTRIFIHCFELCCAILSLHQEENLEPMNVTTTATTTATTAATATAAAVSTKKRARECDVVGGVQKRSKLHPIKLKYLSLDDVQGSGKLTLYDWVALEQDGICSKWAVVKMMPDEDKCLLMVSSSTKVQRSPSACMSIAFDDCCLTQLLFSTACNAYRLAQRFKI
jgi:hypothetical protein